jgi:drug/metabolite transporter (DMT)-like permease
VPDLLHSGAFWALTSAFLWACAVVLFQLAGRSTPPLALNLFKGIVAMVTLVPLVAVAGGGAPLGWSARTWVLLSISGVIGITVADTLFFMALNRLGAGLNAIVTCLYYPVIALFAHLFLSEELQASGALGAAFIVVGILVGTDVRSSESPDRATMAMGLGLGVSGLLAMAFGVVLMKGIVASEPVLWTTTVRLAAGTIALAPLVWWGPDREAFRRLVRPSSLWRHALPGAVLGGAFSMLAWIAGFAMTDATRAAILNQLSTIFVFVLAAVVLKEPFAPRRVAAILLAFTGALLVIV